VIVEAMMRLLPGALGNEASAQQESFTVDAKVKSLGGADSTCGSNGLWIIRITRGQRNFAGSQFRKR